MPQLFDLKKSMSRNKKRVFVAEISSKKYSQLEALKNLRRLPRVIKVKQVPWFVKTRNGRVTSARKDFVEPTFTPIQSLYLHFSELPPGKQSKGHGHQNDALFYVLSGRGHDIHDGVRSEWRAGDVIVIPPGVHHAHNNDDREKPARFLVMKAKPLYLMMHLMFQSPRIDAKEAKVEESPEALRYKGPADGPKIEVMPGYGGAEE